MNNRLLHTPEGVRDIYGKEYARKLAVEIFRHPPLNFSMYFPRRLEPRPARSFISFLTRKEIHWC